MYMYNTFRVEIHKHKSGVISFYKFFLSILDYFIKRSNAEVLAKVINIVSEDDRIFSNLVSILYNDFPDSFNYLVTKGLLNRNIDTSDKINFIDDSYGNMKTVMKSSILALSSK